MDKFMNLALSEARKAYDKQEVPVGCVIVKEGKVIAKAHNQKESKKLATAHAEILAIEKASKKLNNWRLEGCTAYITLEPCPMCMSALEQSRISNVIIGAKDSKERTANPVLQLEYQDTPECEKILKDFFIERRS